AEVALGADEHVDERREVVRRGGRGRGCRGRAGKHADGERRGERAGDGAAQQAGPATKGCGVVPTGSDSAVKTRGGCSGHVDSPWGVVPRLLRLESTPYVARVTTSRRARVPHPVESAGKKSVAGASEPASPPEEGVSTARPPGTGPGPHTGGHHAPYRTTQRRDRRGDQPRRTRGPRAPRPGRHRRRRLPVRSARRARHPRGR